MRVQLLLFVLLSATPSSAEAPPGPARPTDPSQPERVARDASNPLLQSDRSSLNPASRRAVTDLDTFTIYGGPARYPEGRFEDEGGSTSWNGWTSADLSDTPLYWHVDTFNAENLQGHGPGNHALWSGQAATDQPQWVSPPGYGNSWFDALIYESTPLADTSAPQVVDLDFYFNHDVEPGYDFFRVQYDSAGQWIDVYSVDGANVDSMGVFTAPGVHYAEAGARPIAYAGNDYGGERGDRIRIRLVVDSDEAYSDEDGMFDSAAGAAQIDDVVIVTNEGTFTEDFEGPGPYLLDSERMPFAGDFADVYPGFRDIDPCRDNLSPLAGFLDYGQIVRNGPGVDGSTSTGGSTSPGIYYGVPGSWVTNYTGGLSYGLVPLCNCIESPEIDWDLPGADDGDPALVGAMVAFSAWVDLPFDNGIVFYWQFRSASAGSAFDLWRDDNWVYFGSTAGWSNYQFDVSRHLLPDPERVQLRFCVWDTAAIFGVPGIASTPSPLFDNVRVQKFRAGGPRITATSRWLPGDGFPASGSIDVSSPAARDALDVPFDMGQDRNSGDLIIVPGDSTVVTCEALLPGTSLQDLRMVWALKTNPVFENALRAPPAGPRDVNVVAGPAGTVWTGELLAMSIAPRPPNFTPEFSFDLPDADFLYPGDVLHYYFRATDSDGRISTLPPDLAGFGEFNGTFPVYGTIRALPTVKDTSGAQPRVLIVDDTRLFPHASALEQSLIELGLVEGVDYDMYRRRCVGVIPGSDGIGSSGGHGASLSQIAGYSTILYFSRNRGLYLLGGGPGETPWTKSDDIALLEAWHRLPGRRNAGFFGDRLAESLTPFPSGLSFLSNTMGVQFVASDVVPQLGGDRTPWVQADYPGFSAPLFLNFWCQSGVGPSPRNHVVPAAGATRGHAFSTGTPGQTVDGAAASVVFPNPHPGVTGYDVTFPYSLSWMYPLPQRAVALSGRTLLLRELLLLFEENPGSPPVVAAPERTSLELSASPNPFNPRTVIHFDVASGTTGTIQVFTIRGELVRTIHRGPFETDRFVWDGTDRRGARVASGVYLIRASAEGERRFVKVAVIR